MGKHVANPCSVRGYHWQLREKRAGDIPENLDNQGLWKINKFIFVRGTGKKNQLIQGIKQRRVEGLSDLGGEKATIFCLREKRWIDWTFLKSHS